MTNHDRGSATPQPGDDRAKLEIREIVRDRYAQAAQQAAQGRIPSCCGGGSCGERAAGFADPITRDLYDLKDREGLPPAALLASLGCGNPTALAELAPGETVLDLGSGGGIDVLLSARRVGPQGKAFGLDMTDEMLEVARENQRQAGARNVEFLKGTIEEIPLPDDAVDVIISNCVINLSGDKDRVLREAFRVLRSGGRFAVSDIVLTRPLPPALQRSVALWTGCVAGALVMDDYRRRLQDAGFAEVSFEVTRSYGRQEIVEMAAAIPARDGGPAAAMAALEELDGAVVSAFIRARKP